MKNIIELFITFKCLAWVWGVKKWHFWATITLLCWNFSHDSTLVSRCFSFEASSTKKAKRGKRVTLAKERAMLGTRNGMKIFYECIVIIFLQHKPACCYTLYSRCCCVFMLVVAFYSKSIHYTFDMTREFFFTASLKTLRKEDCRRARLTPSTASLFQIKQIDIYLRFPCQNMNSNFFYVHSKRSPRNTKKISENRLRRRFILNTEKVEKKNEREENWWICKISGGFEACKKMTTLT